MEMRLALVFLLLVFSSSQTFNIYPGSSYNLLTPSSQACFSNCQFCQILTGFCEQCLAPFFQKDVNGNCVLVNGYTIQSSPQQLTSGAAFIPSNISWSSTRLTTCNPNTLYFQQVLVVLGPFSQSDGTITYRRSISSHNYIQLNFFFLKMGWIQSDSLSIIIMDQNSAILSNQTIGYSTNVPNETLCSSSLIDQRFQVSYSFQDTTTTSIFISFTPNFVSKNSKWAISTFLLLTGNCNSACSSCNPSIAADQCLTCKNFFMKGTDNTCSQCADGFNQTIVNGVTICSKCSIQYKSCQTNNQMCFYNYLPSQLNSNCTWNSNYHYLSNYEINTDLFSGSLFTVNYASSTYQCGDYSIVGLVNQGQPITRIFTTLQNHQQISLTFNFFIIDQPYTTDTKVFIIYIDNIMVQTLFVNTRGISNICAGPNNEVFQTFPATNFFNHNNTQNVNITILSSNTDNWGIRNFRLSLHTCDSNCLLCGPNGCITCNGYLTLSLLSCSICPAGSSLSSSNACNWCPNNCLSCLISQSSANQTVVTCTSCKQGYFIFQGQCQILSNIGDTVIPDSSKWSSTNSIDSSGQCSINYNNPNSPYNKNVTFLVGSNNLQTTINLTQPHYKMLISFYLLKIDNWTSTDQINLYLNDLLVLNKTYSQIGNRICYQQLENDFLSYEQIQIEDNNQTLTAYFEVVTNSSSIVRKFGVSDFEVNPVACQSCLNYDFSYKIDYNYDEILTVHVIFNRLYVNNDAGLFTTVFLLYVNGINIPYVTAGNDSIRYILQAQLAEEVILSNLTVYCQYPQKITTDITNSVNQKPFFIGRLMQQSQIDTVKSLSNSHSSMIMDRFTPLTSPSSVNGIRVFFEVVTRMVIYISFFAFFIGCLTPCTHFMHNIQKLWLHIYVASLTIPNVLKFALKGFRQSQDQNIAINPSAWQIGIPSYLYYDAPAQYQDYYHDITFFRNIYNVGFAAALYLLFAVVMYFLFRANSLGRPSTNKFIRHMKITFYRRPFFVFNSVIFYQFITVNIACTLQFIDLSTHTYQPSFKGVNGAATIITYILATAYPLINFFYLSYKQKDLYSIDYQVTYRNRYHQIFYRFLPQNLWKSPNYDFESIGFKQRFYNLLRFGQIWWMCLIFALMYGSPFTQAFLLIITNFFHLVFLWISNISYTKVFNVLKVLELIFFVGLQILILVAYQQNQTLTQDAYDTLGIVGIVFVFVILLLSLIRFIYTLIKLISEYKQNYTKEQKMDERLRNDDFYESFQNNNEKIISEQ